MSRHWRSGGNRRKSLPRKEYPLGESNNARFPGNFEGVGSDNARDNAFRPENLSMPPDLAVVVQAWTDLPESAREAVLRIVAEARQGGEVGSP